MISSYFCTEGWLDEVGKPDEEDEEDGLEATIDAPLDGKEEALPLAGFADEEFPSFSFVLLVDSFWPPCTAAPCVMDEGPWRFCSVFALTAGLLIFRPWYGGPLPTRLVEYT